MGIDSRLYQVDRQIYSAWPQRLAYVRGGSEDIKHKMAIRDSMLGRWAGVESSRGKCKEGKAWYALPWATAG